MKEFIEKLIGRLGELSVENTCSGCPHKEKCDEVQEHITNEKTDLCGATIKALAIEIVNELAEEHKGGWIPCSERLPEDDSICIVTVEYPNNETEVDYGWFDRVGVCWYVGIQEFRTSNILAWQPLPEPYTEGELE